MALKRHVFEAPAVQQVLCAHTDCVKSALCRVKTATGWANLCADHYATFWNAERIQKHGINRGEKDNAVMREIRARFMASSAARGELGGIEKLEAGARG